MVKEWLRQCVHLVCGVLLASVASVSSQQFMVVLLGVLLIISIIFSRLQLGFVLFLEQAIDRQDKIRGRGVFTMLFGALLTALLFPQQIVISLLVLAIADSLSTIIGFYFGNHILRWNPSSTYEGSLAFFVSSSALLIPYGWYGVIIAFLVTLFESLDYDSFTFLDDNIVVPVSTGSLLFLVSLL